MYRLIVNLVSGNGEGKEFAQAAERFLTERNLEFKTDFIQQHGQGKDLAQQACNQGADVVIAIGGDGTFHEVLNGMDFSKTRLGLIPAGRGNDYATSALLKHDPIQMMGAIVAGKPVDLDYIQVGSHRCLNVCGTGLDVEVLRMTEVKKNSYVASLAGLLVNYKPYTVQVEVDGLTKEYKCVMAAFCNGRCFGGGIKICPPANIGDGKMDLMVIQKPLMPTIFAMPAFVAGKHMQKKWVQHVLCQKAKIVAEPSASIEIDGEIYDENILDASIVPGGLKTFCAGA